jgi:uncharacterized Fe-S cluster-containing radical SAM superfamily protein
MRASGANCKYTASGLCWNWVVSHSFPRETIIHDLSWLIRKPMSTKSGTEKVRTSKPKRIYAPRIISDHIMVQEDFERLHKFLLETEGLTEVSDDMRELVEEEWPELVHKLPPKVS